MQAAKEKQLVRSVLTRGIALLTTADIRLVPEFATWTIVLCFALVAVGSFGVVLAVLANATAIVVSMDVQGEALAVDLLIVFALVAVAMTIAG